MADTKEAEENIKSGEVDINRNSENGRDGDDDDDEEEEEEEGNNGDEEGEEEEEDGGDENKEESIREDSKPSAPQRPKSTYPEIENRDYSPEANLRLFTRVMDEYEEDYPDPSDKEIMEDLYNFPEDPEKWTEADLQEFWEDASHNFTKPGWDPIAADEEDWEAVRNDILDGREPPIAPFYVPFRPYYPVVAENNFDVNSPKAVIEELDRIEEFLQWYSVIFSDGTTYEGTVWDDLAHGKGVYVSNMGLVRYEGEWVRNMMEGHGVVEIDIPEGHPRPGSKLEAEMRAQGKIIKTDFMSPEDRKWLKMDIEDSIKLAGGRYETPFYENNEWVKVFGQKPEKGRYKYAGQWKHGKMHGCGVHEVNERILYGRFYFGDYVDDSTGCDVDTSAVHAGIAEVAAAKARMFTNKPDGMVREDRGPYGDPQHPYFYEEDDAWMAPGFINQFYEVPDYWKTYVEDVDQEREMWLNSFYKSPLRIPMPAELSYWWENDESPEFVLINKEPEVDPEDSTKLVYTEDPLILHTPTGRLINYVDDEEHGIRLFWQPPLEEGEEIDPEKVEFLPLGFDEFYGRVKPDVTEHWSMRLITKVENALKPSLDKLEKWTDEKKKESEMKMKLMEHEVDLIEAEICLEEELEDLEMELKKKQRKEEEKPTAAQQDVPGGTTDGGIEGEAADDEDEDEDEAEDEEVAPSSFGTVSRKNADQGKGNQSGKPPFSSLSLSFDSFSAIPAESIASRKNGVRQGVSGDIVDGSSSTHVEDRIARIGSISYPRWKQQQQGGERRLRAVQPKKQQWKHAKGNIDSHRRLNGLAKLLCSVESCRS